MNKRKLIKLFQHRVSELAVSSSALRNQGAKEVVKIARAYFDKLKLSSFVTQNEIDFQKRLNSVTIKLVNKFPKGARNWGTARKAINLFLRDVLYNSYLNKYYSFRKVEKWLEVPLDSFVIKGIKNNSKNISLPRWNGIKHLKHSESNIFQKRAKDIAKKKVIAKTHLDLFYWRPKATNRT
jgi:hypothetical protein